MLLPTTVADPLATQPFWLQVGKRFAGLNHTSAFNAFGGHVHGTVFRLPDTPCVHALLKQARSPWIARWLLAKETFLHYFIPLVVRSTSLGNR